MSKTIRLLHTEWSDGWGWPKKIRIFSLARLYLNKLNIDIIKLNIRSMAGA